MTEIYVSTDIETNGPIPGKHSMLSIGSAAYLADKTLVDTFSANLETLKNGSEDPNTMKWWQTQPTAWQACRQDCQSIQTAMDNYVAWLDKLPGKPIFVGYPSGFDFTFVYWYLMHFVGHNPFSFSAIDIKTYAMAMLKKPFRQCAKTRFPKEWFDDLPHTHIALDDAIEQGALFCNLLRLNTQDD